MKYTSFISKKFLQIIVLMGLIFTLVACGKDNSDGFNVVSSIDPSSIVMEDNIVRFTATGENGMTIRFQGIGVTVEEDCLIFDAGAQLFSLDYMGKLNEVTIEVDDKGIDGNVDYGPAYANSASLENMTELRTGFAWSVRLFDKTTTLSITECDTGFLALLINAGKEVKVKEITLDYDATVPQVYLNDLDPMGEIAQLLDSYAIDWQSSGSFSNNVDTRMIALQKIENEGVLRSDLVEGIDRSSIVTEGNKTFFSVNMCDGAVVRFEGKNIEIVDEGIKMNGFSEITSLDAIGKIYGYFPTLCSTQPYEAQDWFTVGYGYTYSDTKNSVDNAESVHTWGVKGFDVTDMNGENILDVVVYEPNFVYVCSSEYNIGSYVLSNLLVCYDPTEKITGINAAKLNADFASVYLEGEKYDASIEQSADLENGNINFYLVLEPDTEVADINADHLAINYVPSEFFKVGALKDANGNELDKKNAIITNGCSLDVTIGDYMVQVPLETVEQYTGAKTMHDLVPYAYSEAVGDLNTLVVPVIWADQTHMANEDTLQFFRAGMGRIIDEKGNVTDYSDTTDEQFSLSEYFDIASYGKMKITSFITDWYYSTENFADVYSVSPDETYANNIMDWVRETYPDMDFSKYDKDGNGYVDSMIILNAGVRESDDIFIIAYEGAINYRHSYYGDLAGTQDAPRVNTYSTVGYKWLEKDYATIIHEFSHGFGLIDYYDVNYSGIDAVGSFDMQSASVGDWNCYSKLAVGWMEPQVVEGLTSGQSVEYTIGSSALVGDVILIPAKGKTYDGPFGEYIMIDLFTDDGVNEFDASLANKGFNLENAAGVRISHVNAAMEKRTNTVASVYNESGNQEYTIGTIHFANDYRNDAMGRYNVEVIQSGGKNTFTDLKKLDTLLSKDDFFYAGDKFDVADYKEFFYEGLMDDGSEFGYIVEILSIGTNNSGEKTATIRVTAK